MIVNKHADAAALAQRQDIEHLNAGAIAALRGKGMIINQADSSGFRIALGAFYARWKMSTARRRGACLKRAWASWCDSAVLRHAKFSSMPLG